MREQYLIKLAAFEGPMDLLMHLIEKNKLNLYDIPIAELTRQYLDYIGTMHRFDIEVASEFLVMAATLLRIKSRMMLPKEEDEVEEEDPRRELVERLLEYRRFKEVTERLFTLKDAQYVYVERAPLHLPAHHLPPENLSVKTLGRMFCEVLRVKEEPRIPSVVIAAEEYRVQDKMTDILALLKQGHGSIKMHAVFPTGTREELLASFLALLELIKMQMVVVRQECVYEEIQISVKEGSRAVS